MSTKALRELFVIKNFCHEIIGNYNREYQTRLSVKEFFIEPVTEVVGFLCDYHSLTLQCFEEVKSEKVSFENAHSHDYTVMLIKRIFQFLRRKH